MKLEGEMHEQGAETGKLIQKDFWAFTEVI
jgi:hypothetical protein